MQCQFDNSPRQINVSMRCSVANLHAFFMWCAFCFVTRVVRNPVLIRNSMELIKEITDILREIIASGDEQGFRRLKEIVRVFKDSRQSVESRALH